MLELVERDSIVTHHARKRFSKRSGLSKKLTKKKSTEALNLGLERKETTGNLHRYLTKLYYHSESDIRVHHQMIYVFEGNVVVTVMMLPQYLRALSDKLQRKKRERMEVIE